MTEIIQSIMLLCPARRGLVRRFLLLNIRCVSNGLSEREKGFFAREYKNSLDKKERKKLDEGSRKTDTIKEDKEKVSAFVQYGFAVSTYPRRVNLNSRMKPLKLLRR